MHHAVGLLNGSKVARWFCPVVGKRMFFHTDSPGTFIGCLEVAEYIALKSSEDNEI